MHSGHRERVGVANTHTHRIDVPSDEVPLALTEEEVLSSEGDHSRLRGTARQLGHTIGLETTASDDPLGLDRALCVCVYVCVCGNGVCTCRYLLHSWSVLQ